MSTPDTKLVRLVGYQSKKGYVLQRLMVHRKLYRNQAPEGNGPGKWYEVPEDIANLLADKTQPNSDLRAFDVCTQEQADRLDSKAHTETRRPARRPQKLNFDNVPGRAQTSAVPLTPPPEPAGQPDFDEGDDGLETEGTEPVADAPIPAAAARGRRRRATRPATSTE